MSKAPFTIDTAVAVAFNMEGRDKINKLIQYGSRAIGYYLIALDPKSNMGKRFYELYKVMQLSRKGFRLGKSVPFYQKAVVVMEDKTLCPIQKYLKLIQYWGMCGFFVYDNMVFLSKSGFIPFNAEEAGRRGGVVWFCANVAGFVLAMKALNEDLEKEKSILSVLKSEKDPARVESLHVQLSTLRANRQNKFLTMVKVLCDLIVSANTPGVRLFERIWSKKLHDGIIGLVGSVSASIVLYNTWPNKK